MLHGAGQLGPMRNFLFTGAILTLVFLAGQLVAWGSWWKRAFCEPTRLTLFSTC